MIRFYNEWKRYPTATIHQNTRNRSFVELAAVYRKMGIKNHFFHLALIHPELANVDPHDQELTEDIKLKVSQECKYNVWYFLREVVRIPPAAGNVPIPFKANRGNIALTWLFLCNVDVALIQPRQTGKSVSTDALMTWLIFFGMNNSAIALITKDHSLRVTNVERLKKLRDLLPPYLVAHSKLDANNQIEITYKELGNVYNTKVAQNSETQANNVGRGNTVPVLHCDEGPFINLIGTTLPAALAAGTAAREEAERNGMPFGNIFTTTAGKKDDRDGKYMYNLINDGAVWTEKFFDCETRDDLHEMVRRNCRGHKMIVNCTFSHRQLGKSDEWLYEAIANAGGTPEQIDRDFFNIWTAGTQRSPLSVHLNEAIRHSEKDPEWIETSPEGFILRWYIPEAAMANRMQVGSYAIGLDTSEAVGRDDIALVMVDLADMSVVCAGNFNETSMLTFSNFLGWFMERYRRATLVIERKSTAISILANICYFLHSRGIDPFKRIFNWVVEDKYERIEDYRDIMQDMTRRGQYYYDTYVSSFGFVTGSGNRDALFGNNLQEAAKKAGNAVHDKVLSDQIRGLVVKNNRIDHINSGHDDSVVAWLLAHWFAANVRHLDYYGIDPKYVMSRVSDNAQRLSDEEIARREEQLVIKQEIEEICEELRTTLDPASQMQLELRLKVLFSRVENDGSMPSSVAELLANAQEKRRMSVRMSQARLNNGEHRGGFSRTPPRAARQEVEHFGEFAPAWTSFH